MDTGIPKQPIVSLANVAQLAADLLIHSLELQSVGCLRSKYHIPLVSPLDYVESSSQATQTGGLSPCVEGRFLYERV